MSIDKAQFREWWESALEGEEDWRRQAEEDFDFVLGDQWSAADRSRLKADKKPMLTINKTLPLVRLVSGYQRTHRHTLKYLPAVDDADVEMAHIIGQIANSITQANHFEYPISRSFTDGIVCGRGWSYGTVDYSYSLDGRVRLLYQNPLLVMKDPNSYEPDLSDAEFVIRWSWLTARQIEATYPDIDADELFPGVSPFLHDDLDPYEPDERRKGIPRFKVVEFWYRDNILRFLAFVNGQFIELPSKRQLNAFVRQNPSAIRYIHQQPIIRYAIFVGNADPIEGDSPFGNRAFPLIPYTAFSLMGEEFGLVTTIKDPQREINKRRSQFIHMVTTETYGGWIGEEQALKPEDWKRLEKSGGQPIILQKRPGSQIIRIDPPGNVALAPKLAEQAAYDDLHQTSGINPELLGMTGEATNSGRVVALRQQQGLTMLGEVLDNLRLTHIAVGEFLLGAIQNLFTYERVFRVIGDSGNPESIRVNQPTVERILNDTSVGEYDVVVEQQPYQPTQRWMLLYALLDFANAGLPIPWSAVLEATDLPNKEQLLQEMQQQAMLQSQMREAPRNPAAGQRRRPTPSRGRSLQR